MRIRVLVLSALIIVLSACGKDPGTDPTPPPVPVNPAESEKPSDEPKTKTVQLSAVLEAFTKSTLDGGISNWTSGDEISLFGAEGSNSVLKMVSSDGVNAVFSGEADARGPWTAVFPYKEDNSFSEGSVTVNIPSQQQIPSLGCVGTDAMVCIGTSGDLETTLPLKNVTALIGFTLAIDQADMKSVTIRTPDGSPLTGKVKVNPSTGEVTEVLEGCDHVTLTNAGGTFVGGEYHASVIPGKYEGLIVTCTRTTDARKAERTG